MAQDSGASRVIEAAGKVEFARAGAANWTSATNGLALNVGDRLRTDASSRAAVQFSDRSVIRLNERTLLEIQPPLHAEKKRFRLPFGSLFFFNRERPSSVEFETPLAAGAIRGTEFYLEANDNGGPMALALLDGLVDLQTSTEHVSLQSGEQVRIAAGQPAVKTALINAVNVIQWALYYPAVVNPSDIDWRAGEQDAFARSIELYRAGDLLAALAAAPEPAAGSEAQQTYRAALALAVGRVDEAEKRLQAISSSSPASRALRQVIDAVRGAETNAITPDTRIGTTSSELLAASYWFQSRSRLEDALRAAHAAAQAAPEFGFAHARVAELEFAFEHRRAALQALDRALALSPRHGEAHVVRGFVLLEQEDATAALQDFDKALGIDAGLGNAWLGRGLALMRLHRVDEARQALQAAAALEPQRSVFRSYLGKAYSQQRDVKLADKEFRLARQLDPNDPTAWLYSALHAWQENRINEAVRDLETSSDLNNNRSVYRSQLLLDRDRSVRSANLAAIYADAGLPDVSRHLAARSVAEDYANFSGHLFLSDSLQAAEDPNRFNLRFETARQSELLLANLLAPPGAGNLSQVLSQQEHLRFFDPRPFGLSSLTEYRSSGDWLQAGSVFGTLGKMSYAVDSVYESQNGQQPNEEFERNSVTMTLKQQVTAADSLYFQGGWFDSHAGDLAQHYDPAAAVRDLRAAERQEPTLYLGWHHEWAPGSHTLLLLSRLTDHLGLNNPPVETKFFHRGTGFTGIEDIPGLREDFTSEFTLYSAELQQIFETHDFSLIAGGRYQHGTVESDATLVQVPLSGTLLDQSVDSSLDRENVYTYGSWQVFEPLRLIAGVSYDRVRAPENTDLPPLTSREKTRDLVAPKVGLEFAPWKRGLLRAGYTRSLGGLFFDNSVRLEPTQIAGINQAYRSLIPESVAGLVPGTEFDTASVGFDQSFKSGTYMGIEAEWLASDGSRGVGMLSNATIFATARVPFNTKQTLDFEERNISAYIGQLLGNSFSVGARYRLSDARLEQHFPQIPNNAIGLGRLETDTSALLHQVGLTANFNHRTGVFAQWESVWLHQHSGSYVPALQDEDMWQHNAFVGYRFPRRYAEVRLGVLNLTGSDYRLNPLNLHAAFPRERTFIATLRLNF